jgi:hypothetical protein
VYFMGSSDGCGRPIIAPGMANKALAWSLEP